MPTTPGSALRDPPLATTTAPDVMSAGCSSSDASALCGRRSSSLRGPSWADLDRHLDDVTRDLSLHLDEMRNELREVLGT